MSSVSKSARKRFAADPLSTMLLLRLAGIASRDYDFRPDGGARIPKGTAPRLYSRSLPTYMRYTPSQHGCSTAARRESNKGIPRGGPKLPR